jgi:phage repressor protein C with HTH and peptisase S24 domain
MRMRLSVVLVAGESMRPTLRPGDRLLVASGVRVSAGDVVVSRIPDSDVLAVKRAAFRQDGGWWLESDNQGAPGRRDSWDFGAVRDEAIVGRVLVRYWPLPPVSSFRQRSEQ